MAVGTQRAVKKANSEVKYRKHGIDLESHLDWLLEDWVLPTGEVIPSHFPHRANARRHTLMDNQSKWRRNQYHRAVRRDARREIQSQLEMWYVIHDEDGYWLTDNPDDQDEIVWGPGPKAEAEHELARNIQLSGE